MKIMRIGSSLINLDRFVSIEGRSCNDGVVITVEHDHSVKEYLIPNETNPELVIAVIKDCINQYDTFNLPLKLKAERGMI